MAKLTPDEQQAILDLIDAGHTRNDIARRTHRSPGTITNIARANDRTFDRTETETATRARQVDMAARRAAIAAGLLDDVVRLRGELFAPCVERRAMVVSRGGDRGSAVEIVEVHHPRPPFADQQRIMTCVGIAVDKVLAIDRHDNQADEGLAAVDRWLREMIGEAVG